MVYFLLSWVKNAGLEPWYDAPRQQRKEERSQHLCNVRSANEYKIESSKYSRGSKLFAIESQNG